MNDLRICELFCGIGGFRHGLEKASKQFKTVFANELDKWAASIYRHHWNDGSLCEGDIRNIKAQDIPDFDLLCGGFPCQPFSTAGKRSEFRDPRGTLIYEVLRIAKEKQPKMLLLENVPGLLNIQRGQTFQTILEGLGNLGYICEWKVFNSKFFGVPQSRRRVFIVAYLTSLKYGGGTVFPIGDSNAVGVKSSQGQVCGTLTAGYGNRHGGDTYLIVDYQFGKTRIYADTAPTLTARMGTAGGKGTMLTTYVADKRLRKLTPLECERLQSFPDHWTKYGLTTTGKQVEISNTQRYKAVGNAVTINVIAEIGKLILTFFENSHKPDLAHQF
ncbi:DNA cytosine methyltransferase [Candidatus Bathycorpusculum sp.]|uniref:DNA cytosine methyltransferase n=1 Tax=Candidatus Bathycorpusculum sp. TaxID=2994959 RepID=UPI0028328EEF|nr:DNA cytosine methyltransferase [Candidatus Termitimicrobium sp.]MCL2432669.1 DNA cytosine methyltransferase [Candidatus Termitimicrobium sp.]